MFSGTVPWKHAGPGETRSPALAGGARASCRRSLGLSAPRSCPSTPLSSPPVPLRRAWGRGPVPSRCEHRGCDLQPFQAAPPRWGGACAHRCWSFLPQHSRGRPAHPRTPAYSVRLSPLPLGLWTPAAAGPLAKLPSPCPPPGEPPALSTLLPHAEAWAPPPNSRLEPLRGSWCVFPVSRGHRLGRETCVSTDC